MQMWLVNFYVVTTSQVERKYRLHMYNLACETSWPVVLCTINTSYCEADSVSGDVSVRRVANVEPDCCCLCANKICVSAFMKGVISCREHKDIVHESSTFTRTRVTRCVPRLAMTPDPPLPPLFLRRPNAQYTANKMCNLHHYPTQLKKVCLKC